MAEAVYFRDTIIQNSSVQRYTLEIRTFIGLYGDNMAQTTNIIYQFPAVIEHIKISVVKIYGYSP